MKGLSRVFGLPNSLQRKYALATVIFAGLILAIIFLFGHLIAGSLSRRYLEDMLLMGQQDAERMADTVARNGGAGAEELHGVSRKRTELYRTLEGLAKKEIIEMVEVYGADGKRVFSSEFHSTEQIPDVDVSQLELQGSLENRDWKETKNTFTVVAPIGQVGQVVLHLSKAALGQRVGRLRHELLSRTLVVASITLLTLVGAFVLIWMLIQRTRRLEFRHQEARELAALGSLAANLAHEIRNPLNSINLNLELVEEDLGDGSPDVAALSLGETRKEVRRLGQLVSDFLTYARPGQAVHEELDFAEIVLRVRKFLAEEARRRGVHLKGEKTRRLFMVRGDAGQLRQVLMNLILNGIQAVEDLEPERKVVEILVDEEDGEISCRIQDRGRGVPSEELGRIREAFVTKKRGGSGLGLAIADRVMSEHGGRLELKNLDNRGFEARIVLPQLAGNGKMSQPE